MIYREGKSFPFFSFASIHLSLLFRPRFCCEPSSCCQCCFAREENIKAWLGLVGCWSPLLFWLRPYLLRIDHFSTRLFLFFFFLLLFFLIEKELKVAVDVLRDRARWRLYFFFSPRDNENRFHSDRNGSILKEEIQSKDSRRRERIQKSNISAL